MRVVASIELARMMSRPRTRQIGRRCSVAGVDRAPVPQPVAAPNALRIQRMLRLSRGRESPGLFDRILVPRALGVLSC